MQTEKRKEIYIFRKDTSFFAGWVMLIVVNDYAGVNRSRLISDFSSKRCPMDEILTPKQVAQALNVSESSIKRWCDRGVIESLKTGGGHRRISIDSLMAFLESTNRKVTDPEAIGMIPGSKMGLMANSTSPGGTRSFTKEEHAKRQLFENALIRGDERECRKILISWYSARETFAAVADELIATTFRNIGELWKNGSIEIFQERRGCEIVARLVQEFRRLILEPLPNSPKAIGASTSGDHYSIPGQLVEVSLREAGWRATNLGANLPFETILEAVRHEQPRLVWISVSNVDDEGSFITRFNQFAANLPESTVFLVGGRILNERMRQSLRYTAYCESMLHLNQVANELRSEKMQLARSG
jgi:MerR family transcriptional regulator, light-induced transcriptional regulator